MEPAEIVPPNREVSEPKGPEYFFDVSRQKILIGEAAMVNSVVVDRANWQDVYPLGYVLRDADIELDASIDAKKKWTRKSALEAGRFLIDILPEPTNRYERFLNENILHRAHRLGIVPSTRMLKDRFGSVGGFYRAIDVDRVYLRNSFDDWTVNDFVSYVKRVGEEVGRRPTEGILLEYSKRNPGQHPSARVMKSKISRMGQIQELAGYLDVYSWSKEDYVDWGVKFMRANDGIKPTDRILDYLSRKQLGPSANAVGDNFGLNNYKKQVAKAFEEQSERKRLERERKLKNIEDGLASGKLPPEIFEKYDSDDERILKYARFIVLDELIAESMAERKISIVTMRNPTVALAGFVGSIRKVNNAITAGDVEATASYLGVFDDIWPEDTSYLEKLRLPDEMHNASIARHKSSIPATSTIV